MALKFKPGDEVWITGVLFQSANGTLKGKSYIKEKGKIKKIAEGAPHPYAVEGVWGWFDESSISKYIEPPNVKVGDIVSLKRNLTYSGQRFTPQYKIFEILEIDDDRVVIGRGGVKYSIVSIYNLEKV